jgi:hypothetical protein
MDPDPAVSSVKSTAPDRDDGRGPRELCESARGGIEFRETTADSILANGQPVWVSGKLLRTARIPCEYYDSFDDPEEVLKGLREQARGADAFSFLQGIPDPEPHFPHRQEWDVLGVLPIRSYDEWWKNQISDKTRNVIRKAGKSGLEIRPAQLDDEFVRGVVDIYHESPVRQGKPFVHYGKDFATIKNDLSTFPGRSEFVGAYHQGVLIGFIKFVKGKGFASLMHILSTMASRHLCPTNALIARAVQMCSEQGIPYLHYGLWSRGGLGLFKRNHGFLPHRIPRYWVPLSLRGRLLISLGFHRRLKDRIPESWKDRLVDWRSRLAICRLGRRKR